MSPKALKVPDLFRTEWYIIAVRSPDGKTDIAYMETEATGDAIAAALALSWRYSSVELCRYFGVIPSVWRAYTPRDNVVIVTDNPHNSPKVAEAMGRSNVEPLR